MQIQAIFFKLRLILDYFPLRLPNKFHAFIYHMQIYNFSIKFKSVTFLYVDHPSGVQVDRKKDRKNVKETVKVHTNRESRKKV